MQSLSFDEFVKTSWSDWQAALEKELKGKSPDILNWKDDDGLLHSPYYRPGFTFPFSTPDLKKEWAVLEEFDMRNPGVNRSILTALNGGVNAIEVQGALTDGSCELVFQDVILPYIQLHFDGSASTGINGAFAHYVDKKGYTRESIQGTVQISSPTDEGIAEILHEWPKLSVVAADARTAHSMGSSPSDDILLCLSRGHEVLLTLLRAGIDPERISNGIQFNLTSGRSFFTEMAKMLALRILWRKLAAGYNLEGNLSLMVSTSDFWQSGIDVENNLLRASAQAMSAICGGADVLHIRPHDGWKGDGSEESRRWARNISHLISDESGLAVHRQAARQSHMVQSLVSSLCNHTWKRFVESENAGGWPVIGDSLLAGISERGNKVRETVADATQVMIGVNKYPGRADEHIAGARAGRASSIIENSGI
ncbi:MAG: hypothetical protein RL220_1964 [Bacteroidota bacterium]|jgi:methylmalonyl-CoA mutase